MKKIALGIGIAGVGAYAAAMKYFFDLGFNARKPNGEFQMIGAGTPYEEKGKEGAAWLNDFESDTVYITSVDGLKLKGHYFACPGAKRTVIAFHGWRGRWYSDYACMGRWLYENGCNLLFPEQRCQNGSEGKFMGFGVTESMDVPAWVAWLDEAHPSSLPVYIIGLSMGAATVLMACGKKLPDNVKGIIADCGFTCPYEMLKVHAKDAFNIPEHPMMDTLNVITKVKMGLDLKAHSTIDAMKQAEKPILFITGTADTFVPSYMTRQNYEACVSEKKLFLVEGADHCMADHVDFEGYTGELTEFFSKYDG